MSNRAQPVPPQFNPEDLFMPSSPNPLDVLETCEDQDERDGVESGTSLNHWLHDYEAGWQVPQTGLGYTNAQAFT